MSHPLKYVIQRNQMSGNFIDDAFSALKQAGQSAIDKAKTKAITNIFNAAVNNKEVKDALIESGNETAIQNLASWIKDKQSSAVTYYKENPTTSKLLLGAAAIAVVGGVVLLIRGRR